MGVTVAAAFEFVGAAFGGEAAAAAVAAEAAGAGLGVGATVGGAAAAGVETALAAGGAAGAVGSVLAKEGSSALAASLVGNALRPDIPKPDVKGPIGMPDPEAQAAARRRSLAEQMTRGGRASTILTAPTGTKLGG